MKLNQFGEAVYAGRDVCVNTATVRTGPATEACCYGADIAAQVPVDPANADRGPWRVENIFGEVLYPSASPWVRAGGEVVAGSNNGEGWINWRDGGEIQAFSGRIVDVSPEGLVLTTDRDHKTLTCWNQRAIAWQLEFTDPIVDNDGDLDTKLRADLLTVRTAGPARLYVVGDAGPVPLAGVLNPGANLTIPFYSDRKPHVFERTSNPQQLQAREWDSDRAVFLVSMPEHQFSPDAVTVGEALVIAWSTGEGQLLETFQRRQFDAFSSLPATIDISAAPAPVPGPSLDITTPFPKFSSPKLLAFWKTDTPDSNYGRVQSPSNTIMIEESLDVIDGKVVTIPCRRYDPALHAGHAILCNDMAAGVPAWDGVSGHVGLAGSLESAGDIDRDPVRADAAIAEVRDRIASAKRLNGFVSLNIDGIAWAGLAFTTRVDALSTRLMKMSELYPGPGESQAQILARFERILQYHHADGEATGRHFAVATTLYAQARPKDASFTDPIPGVGFPIPLIQSLQRPMAELLVKYEKWLTLIMPFSMLRYSGALWTLSDGTRPFFPFIKLWVDMIPAGRAFDMWPVTGEDQPPGPTPHEDDMTQEQLKQYIASIEGARSEFANAYVTIWHDAPHGVNVVAMEQQIAYRTAKFAAGESRDEVIAGMFQERFPLVTVAQCVGRSADDIRKGLPA